MSNKKRINKRVEIIQNKARLSAINSICTWLVGTIKSAEEVKRSFKKLALAYESGRIKEPERIIDSHGDINEFVLPKNLNYNKFKIKDKDYGSATFNINNPEQS